MFYNSSSLKHTTARPPKKLKIAIINAILNNKAYLFEVSYWITISELKSKIEKSFSIPVASQRLFYKTQEMQNNQSLTYFETKSKIKLILRPTPNLENTLGLIKPYETLNATDGIKSILGHVQEGFNQGLIPKLTFEGTSGTYFLQSKNRKNTAIFKPFDEEPFAPNNPRGYIKKLGSQAFKPGILSGEAAVREVAAFLLDQASGPSAAGVPPTTFVEIVHPYFINRDLKEADIPSSEIIPMQNFSQYAHGSKKVIIKHGSLQQFMADTEEASNFGPGKFSESQVRKIAILDLRILNCDRNEGNILVKKSKEGMQLIPIDHGLTFPDCFEASVWDLTWMEWPQVQKAWSPDELALMRSLNPIKDIETISRHFKFRDICLRNFRIAETVLQCCALSGLTLHETATFMYRDDPEEPSALEGLINETEEFIEKIRKEIPTRATEANGHKKHAVKLTLQVNKIPSIDKDTIYDPLEEAYEANMAFSARRKSQDLRAKHISPQSKLQTVIEAKKTPKLTKGDSSFDFSFPTLERKGVSDFPGYLEIGRQISIESTSKGRKSHIPKETELDEVSSEEEFDKELPEELPAPRPLQRSSSIPVLNFKRSKDSTTELDKKKGNGIANGRKSKKDLTGIKSNGGEGHSYKDELFFKYLVAFLDQKIEIMMKVKSQGGRNRFMSQV